MVADTFQKIFDLESCPLLNLSFNYFIICGVMRLLSKTNKIMDLCLLRILVLHSNSVVLLSVQTTGEGHWVQTLRMCDVCAWSVLKQHVLPDTSGVETSAASICSLAPIGLPSVVHPFRSQQYGGARRCSNGANLAKWRRRVHRALKHSEGSYGREDCRTFDAHDTCLTRHTLNICYNSVINWFFFFCPWIVWVERLKFLFLFC